MNHDMGTMDDIPEGYPPCALYGNGTVQFGHYVPTSAEMTWCQTGRDPWALQFRYGFYTSYFAAVVTFLFILANYLKKDTALSYVFRKPLALGRYIAYPKATSIPALGPFLVWLTFAIFCTAYTFGVTPYIRPPNYGSYPIGVRTGFIATAMLPWLYILAVKRNILSIMAGISYEKFQFMHQWSGWICFVLSVIHTIALTVRAQRQQPWSYTWATDTFFASGIGALVPLFVLCVFSLPFIRRRWYEAFFLIHFIAAIFFIYWMTNHVARQLGSQYYCYVAIALWTSAIVWRYGAITWHILRSGGSLPLMHITLHAGNDDLMTFTIPTRIHWDAGQHVFLRLPGCDAVASHPFTIASLPADERNPMDPEKAENGGKNSMVFLVRAQKGFTKRLRAKAAKMSSSGQALKFPAVIDGPYGYSPNYAGFHSVMLIAGGTGISFALPILQRVLRDIESGISPCTHIELIWVSKSSALFDIFMADLQDAVKYVPSATVLIRLYHSTGSSAEDTEGDTEGDIKEVENKDAYPAVVPSTQGGRPMIDDLITSRAQATTGRMMVAACGPESMLIDVRRGVIHCQMDIIRNRITTSEIVLHSEVFSW